MSKQTAGASRAEDIDNRDEKDLAIPAALRKRVESLLGCRFDTVRIKVGSEPARHGALACTLGETIFILPGLYDPGTARGLELLAHELAHVIQGRAGRVPPSRGTGATVGDATLEWEAVRVGRHCAARLMPGAGCDPGLPTSFRPSEPVATPGGAQASAVMQCLTSSLVSYADFVVDTWQYLIRRQTDAVPLRNVLQVLYNNAADYNPCGVADKAPLVGMDLYAALARYCGAFQGRRAKLQFGDPWPDVSSDIAAYVMYYNSVLNQQRPAMNAHAERAATAYLHVYPNAQVLGDWRIGINVEPRSMAAAAAALAPLLDRFADIDHMKFLGPGAADKADSIIIYLRKTAAYNELRNAVLAAVNGLHLQPRFGAMWNEVAPGVAEAAEPPAGSFTEYRCVAIYVAFLAYSAVAGPHSLGDFVDFLNVVLPAFGINPATPHMQGARARQDPNFPAYWDVFVWLYRTWTG